MFNSISWAEFVAFVTLLLILYYLFIGVKFYFHELKQLMAGNKKISPHLANGNDDRQTKEIKDLDLQEVQPELFTSHQKYSPAIKEADDTFQQVEELTASLKEAIAVAVDKEYIKEEFILFLQLLLRKYHFLKTPTFLVAINNLIASECEKYGYIQLSAEERVMLWNE